jgi:sterol-4alpha-carboxylate 3-dehydrogenase (decarboxylating)
MNCSVDGNQHVLDSAARVGSVRAIVYTSSGPIIAGTGAGYDHADETQPTLAWPIARKGDPYHLAKAMGEKMILEADGKHGIRTACIRPTALYGGEFLHIFPWEVSSDAVLANLVAKQRETNK